MNLTGRDCSPFVPQPNSAQADWLRRLISSTKVEDHVIEMGGSREEDDPIVYCERDGTWWSGRYIGALTFEGSQLTILPRFGLDTLRSWLFQVNNVALVESPGQQRGDEAFIVQLLAAVWSRSFVAAARHGLPALRQEVGHTGTVVRGRLDVAESVRLIAAGMPKVASRRRERSLNNAISRAIVAAYCTIQRWMGNESNDRWIPARARDFLPQLLAVTGPRPVVPSKAELERVHYTPITAPFKAVAELSRQIANRRGLAGDTSVGGSCQGILLDVAELWELYVLAALRHAAVGYQVRHGTLEGKANQALLESKSTGKRMGILKPDALILHEGHVLGIVDAKYKRLTPTKSSIYGPQREDLYQAASYLMRYGRDESSVWAALAYPEELPNNGPPSAEVANAWSLDATRHLSFLTLSHSMIDASKKLESALALNKQ